MNLSRIVPSLPETPGVYLFLDAGGRVLYVGKSVNLRRRVGSYFGRSVEPEVGRLIRRTARIEVRETATELLALLLEDDLVKEHRPDGNARLKKFSRYVWLALSGDPHPTLVVRDDPGPRSGPVFGPYPDEPFARDLRRFVARHLKLRPCTIGEPTSPCAELDLGSCAGPCAGRVTAPEYGRIVARAAGFLSGRDDSVVGRIEAAMRERARALAFEDAARCRDDLEFARRFLARQRFVERFASEDLIVLDSSEPASTYVFRRGRTYARYEGLLAGAELARILSSPAPETPYDERRFTDRAAIVHAWIERGRGNAVTIHRLDR